VLVHQLSDGGGRGIRTPGTLSGTAVFKTACFNHSHIPPLEVLHSLPAPYARGSNRDPRFCHVSDLADAHVLSLKRLMTEKESFAVNLGAGRGISVLEIIRAVEQQAGSATRPHS
jgi:nucleoside-diphosphate-sugar epimerase